MKGFYHIWAWGPSWSCDLDYLYIHWFPLPIDASCKIWLRLAKRFQRRRSLKMVDDGRRTEHGYTISSPCEPDGSGELKKHSKLTTSFSSMSHNKELDYKLAKNTFSAITLTRKISCIYIHQKEHISVSNFSAFFKNIVMRKTFFPPM